MIGVVVKQVTVRLQYTMDFVFSARGIEYQFVSEDDFQSTQLTSFIYYGVKPTDSSVYFEASSLLFEDGIREVSVERTQMKELEILAFEGVSDVFASVFYVLSRYEEYNAVDRDVHDRFPANASILTRFGWIERAVCDRWAEHILNALKMKGETFFQLIPTFDIDNTYAYRYKDGWRARLSYLKDLKNWDFKRIGERKAVKNGARDPYDTYDLIRRVMAQFPQTRLFWLVAPLGTYDRNLSPGLDVHQTLMRSMDENLTLGLHPGYVSNGRIEKIREEKEVFERILQRKVTSSRQHFLRFRLPETYSSLLTCGFTDEYSMGFAEVAGFRAGTARSFLWFDVTQNRITDLRIHPFVYMDGTLNEYLHLSQEECKEKISSLIQEVKDYGGDFVFIWHNETIGDYGKWKGWSEVLNHTLNLSE